MTIGPGRRSLDFFKKLNASAAGTACAALSCAGRLDPLALGISSFRSRPLVLVLAHILPAGANNYEATGSDAYEPSGRNLLNRPKSRDALG